MTLRRGSAALALAAAFVACGSGNPVVHTPPTPLTHRTILGVDVTVHATANITRHTATVEAMDNYYAPTILRGAPGVRVLLIFRNGGFATHNFTFPALGINIDVAPGDIRQATVTFPSSGEVPFFCRFHRASASMIGAVVADPGIPAPK